LKELWIWEERAVNFCCDCSASPRWGKNRAAADSRCVLHSIQ
jgi:hypothetical protein